ncbi:30S ribosome-binding factor RbfA [Georgenia sp. H159]|uniref:30S ribosome-binding factor RbfA n=1 Tax=Georgenia sp. H159 TaxID=3076115 RepID=UPI002D774EA1|nr:30S ribosome-binding factor RbfA [Georgenia sp. H159]
MADTPRMRRVSDRIKQIVAAMLESRIKDPRLGFVTVTEVRVTGDLQHATVYYTVLGDEQEQRDSAAALASARGHIRSEVGKQLGLRLTPTLEFTADVVPETAADLERALREAAERDAELARLAAGATPAGDPDPYRPARGADQDADQDADDAPGS